ncbi:hypothetical protein B0H12DRAFT_1230101 [Mycena haematopus]|nr:hypothetical protein B0H12DRAFT_1230101 [Mycena haematopus]
MYPTGGWLNLRHRAGLSHSNDRCRSFFISLPSYLSILAKRSHHVSNHWSAYRKGHFAHGNSQFVEGNDQFIPGNGQFANQSSGFVDRNGCGAARWLDHRYDHRFDHHYDHRSDHRFDHRYDHRFGRRFRQLFGHLARDLGLSRQNQWRKGVFSPQLRAYNFTYRRGELAICIVHVDQASQLSFVQNDGLFGVDGWVAGTLESMPYVGFSIAVLRRQSGDEDRFRRAMIHATGSTAVAVLGSVGGHYGGPVGAAFVAAVTMPLKMLLQQWAATNLIRDPLVLQEFEDITLGKYLIESISSMIAAGTSNQVSRFFQNQAAQIIEVITYPLLQVLGRWAVTKVGNTANSTLIHKIVEGLVKGTFPPRLLNNTVSSNQLLQGSSHWERNGIIGAWL